MAETSSPGFFRRVLQHVWVDLPPRLDSARESLDHREAKLWSLILSARHVPHRMTHRPKEEGGGYTVQVQEWFAERAVREISLYFEENQPDGRTIQLADLRPVSGLEPTLIGLALLVFFFWAYNLTYPSFGLYPELWLKKGSADAGAILYGEWWRLATALTLHGDGPHVAGNAIIGGVFIWLVSRRLGAGAAWFLTILAGVIGNLLNAMTLGVHHNAIGFSTATFGAAGVLAAITPFGIGGGMHGFGTGGWLRRSMRFVRTALVPFGAGLGLLAMLGAGEDTDLGAHLFGFLAGAGLGVIAGFLATRSGLPGKRADGCLYGAALLIPAACWIFSWVA